MTSFFPALQNSLLPKLLFVSVLLFVTTIVVMLTVRGAAPDGPSSFGEVGPPVDGPAPLFITGGTQAPLDPKGRVAQ